jgi:hypothetical protein
MTDRENAVAYGFLMLAVVLLIFAAFYLALIWSSNVLLNGALLDQSIGINHDIKLGLLPTASVNGINFTIGIITMIPIFIIMSAFTWCIYRAFWVRAGGQ